MPPSSDQLRRELIQAGIANSAIDAVWPQWWSDEANSSMSATAELTYTVARRLGLSPRALLDGSTQFLWRDETKFKNLGTTTEQDRSILAAFGTAVGRCAIQATRPTNFGEAVNIRAVREAILNESLLVNTPELLNLCWSLGIPVIHLRVFPLSRKRMHAMTVRINDRYAILLGLETKYYAVAAYMLAHELSHIFLGHLENEANVLDIENPLEAIGADDEEKQADRLALTVLTGTPTPEVHSDTESYSATQLADAATTAAINERIDPGVLALCLGHNTRKWEKTYGALKIIPPGEQPVSQQINSLAASQFDWQIISYSSQEFLTRVMGLESDDRPVDR